MMDKPLPEIPSEEQELIVSSEHWRAWGYLSLIVANSLLAIAAGIVPGWMRGTRLSALVLLVPFAALLALTGAMAYWRLRSKWRGTWRLNAEGIHFMPVRGNEPVLIRWTPRPRIAQKPDMMLIEDEKNQIGFSMWLLSLKDLSRVRRTIAFWLLHTRQQQPRDDLYYSPPSLERTKRLSSCVAMILMGISVMCVPLLLQESLTPLEPSTVFLWLLGLTCILLSCWAVASHGMDCIKFCSLDSFGIHARESKRDLFVPWCAIMRIRMHRGKITEFHAARCRIRVPYQMPRYYKEEWMQYEDFQHFAREHLKGRFDLAYFPVEFIPGAILKRQLIVIPTILLCLPIFLLLALVGDRYLGIFAGFLFFLLFMLLSVITGLASPAWRNRKLNPEWRKAKVISPPAPTI